jgi:hypothetical protein
VPTKLPTGESPRPDMLFFKTEANGNIDFNDVMYFDSKLDGNTKLSGSQKALSDLGGTGAPFEITNFIEQFNPQIYKPSGGKFDEFDFPDFKNSNVTLRNAEIIGTEYKASDLFNEAEVILKTKPQ